MKKLRFKILAALLTASMLLSGCANRNVQITASGDTTSSQQESTQGDNSQSEDNNSNTATTTTTTVREEKPVENPGGNGFEVSSSQTDWEENGNICGDVSITITNNSDKDVSSWKAQLKVPKDFKITNSWSGKFEVSGDTLTITNEEFNGEITAGGKTSFGFIYSASEKIKIEEITVNGEKKEPSQSSTTTTTPPPTTTTTEEQTEEQNPKPTTTTTPATTPAPAPDDPAGTTPVSQHGQLSVQGTKLVDKNGNAFQLKGMSTHGIFWFPDFVNEGAFKTLRDDWNTNVVRLAMYSGASEGYTGDGMRVSQDLVKKGIEICLDLDMYVIVDWHLLADKSHQVRKADAIKFFDEISKEYGKYPNIIYEICNEPNGYASWEGDIKPYAEEVIPVIRKNDPDSVIIVGTPTWSQDIDKAANNPLQYDNILYALHFYAATHTDWLRQRLVDCNAKGLPVVVSEFGCCDASGNGANDFNQTKQWLQLLDKLGVSYMNWNLANKNESSSAFKPSAGANGNWSEGDLSQSGAWMRKWFRGEIQ